MTNHMIDKHLVFNGYFTLEDIQLITEILRENADKLTSTDDEQVFEIFRGRNSEAIIEIFRHAKKAEAVATLAQDGNHWHFHVAPSR